MDAVQKALRVAKQVGGASADVPQPVAADTGAPAPVSAAAFDPNAFLKSLYQAELGRAPDVPGAQYWTQQIQSGAMTPEEVRRSVYQSPENTIQDMYLQYLNRQPDPQGLSYWQNRLESGGMTADEIARSIQASTEYQKLNPQVAPPAQAPPAQAPATTPVDIGVNQMPLVYVPPPYNDYGATPAAYRVAAGLESLPAPFATLSPVFGASRREQPQQAKTPYEEALEKITQPTEQGPTDNYFQRNRKPTVEDITSGLTQLYKTELGRDPDPEGFKYWQNELKSGRMTMDEVRRAFLASPENIAQDAYLLYLNRAPDPEGLEYWRKEIESGKMSGADVQKAFRVSPEATAPALTKAYQQYLGRTPDAGGLQYWQNEIASGKMTLDQVISAISQSDEARRRSGGFASGGVVQGYEDGGATKSNFDELVRAAYKQFLKRDPDPGGYDYWINELESGAYEPSQFEKVFKGSSYEDEIANAYDKYLGRTPDKEGLEYWTNQLKSGAMFPENLERAFRYSQEAIVNTVPVEDRYSELQGGKEYAINIGNVDRVPQLKSVPGPMNIKQAYENSEIERLRRELEMAKMGGTGTVDNRSGAGDGGGGGGDGTAGGLGDTAGGGGYGSAPGNADSAAGSPAGDGGGPMGLARGGTANNAIDNALRMIKADRR